MCVIYKKLLFLFLAQQVLLCHPAKDKLQMKQLSLYSIIKGRYGAGRMQLAYMVQTGFFCGHRSEMRNFQRPLTDGL